MWKNVKMQSKLIIKELSRMRVVLKTRYLLKNILI